MPGEPAHTVDVELDGKHDSKDVGYLGSYELHKGCALVVEQPQAFRAIGSTSS